MERNQMFPISARPAVEPNELLKKLKKLDNWAMMCFFVGFKYSGGSWGRL